MSLFKPPTNNLEDYILSKDIIYVGGGNKKNLLVLWKEWGLDLIFRKALDSGVILAGLSAGSICWFDEGVTDSIPGKLTKLDCLGFLNGSHCPHNDGESDRRPSYHSLLQGNDIKSGIAADDGVALHYIDNKLIKVVSSREFAKAYHVYYSEYGVVEERIDPIFLDS